MARPLDICIRGGGAVGLTMALLMARKRLRVGLVAPLATASAGAHTDIRAYALNAHSRSLLHSLRCWPQAHHAAPVAAMHVYGDAGGELHFDAQEQQAEALAWIVDAGALQQQLEQAVGFAPEIERLAEPQAAGLHVVCEGATSATPERLGAGVASFRYPQHAIAARLRGSEPHRGAAYQWFANGEILGVLPMADHENAVGVVWSVMEQRAQELLQLDDAAFARELQIASHGLFGQLELVSQRHKWPLKLSRAQSWSGVSEGQAWVLAGDAAHVVHPLAGQGLNLGLADAGCLADVLGQRAYWRATGDPKLLRQYERSRKAEVAAMGLVTDGLQQLFGRQGAAWEAGRNWGMRGFERSGPLKHWLARHAMGVAVDAGGQAGPI